MALVVEMGYNGRLVSLAGVLGAEGKGRIISPTTLVVSTAVIALSANPKRISALLQNFDDPSTPGSRMYVFIGNNSSAPIVLAPLGSLQIDADFPWTGEIWASAPANTPVLEMNEVSIT